MKQGSFAERKLFDNINKWRRRGWPTFAKLHECGFDLGGIERCGRFFSNPTITPNHRAEHHAELPEKPAVAQPDYVEGRGARTRSAFSLIWKSTGQLPASSPSSSTGTSCSLEIRNR